MFPISSTSAPAALAPAQQATAPAPALPALAASPAPASTSVEFSTLAQFLSSVALSRRQLRELQGEAAAQQPTPQELAVLDVAARNLSNAFNNLQVAVTAEAAALDDNANGQLLASRLNQDLEQAEAAGGQPLAASTLAAAGLTLAPAASGVGTAEDGPAGLSALAAPAPRTLLVDTEALGAAFALDRQRTLSILDDAAQRFSELGDAVARQAADSAAVRQAAEAERDAQAEAVASRLADENRRQATGISRDEDRSASALAARMETQRGADQREEVPQPSAPQPLAAPPDQTLANARALATDPSVAAAIAAYHLGSAAFAGVQPRPNPAPPERNEKIAPVAPVTRVAPVQPADQPGGDTSEPRR